MTSPEAEAGEEHGSQAEQIINRYRDCFKFQSALQIKHFFRKS